jgi:hypothetical protein
MTITKFAGQPKVALTPTTDAPGGPKTIASAGQFARHLDKLAVNKVKADLSSRLDRAWLGVLKAIEFIGGDTSDAQWVVSNRLARNVINRLNEEPIRYPNGEEVLLGEMLVTDQGIDTKEVQYDDEFKRKLEKGLEGASKAIVKKYYAAIEPDILESIHSKLKGWPERWAAEKSQLPLFVRYCVALAANIAEEDRRDIINLDTVLDNIATGFKHIAHKADSTVGNNKDIVWFVDEVLNVYETYPGLTKDEILYPNNTSAPSDLARAFGIAKENFKRRKERDPNAIDS